MTNDVRSKKPVKAALLLAAVILFVASCIQQAQKSAVPLTSSDTPDPVPARVSNKTFAAFSHKIPEHTQFECNTCHQRESRGIKSQLGGHESCIGCHMNEWIAEEQAICIICHTDLNLKDPPVKAFPVKFREGFNTEFDHGTHDSRVGCAACHEPSGRGKTIPSGFQAHATCYDCHNAENKNDSCSVCHKIAPYTRTLQSQYSPRIIFSHTDHTGQRCNECHTVRPGAPQSQQVSSIATREHLTTPGFNCLQCHNGRRVFTGNNPLDVGSCIRCHRGPGFAKLPPGTYSETKEKAPAEN